jgi:hypothetical protein
MSYLHKTKCFISTEIHVRVFVFFAKVVLLNVVHPLKIHHNTKFNDPMLTGASFASTSEV